VNLHAPADLWAWPASVWWPTFKFRLHLVHLLRLVTAGYFYDTFAYEICFYGIYFNGIYIYGIYIYKALKF
jgi:hypothetical protein